MKSPDAGFTLIELMVVVSIILIIAAIAIPIYSRSRMNANEATAIGAMRTLSTAQAGFQTAQLKDANSDGLGDFGTLTELGTPAGPGLAVFIDEVLASGTSKGYEFTVEVFEGSGTQQPAFSARAVPLVIERTGKRKFYVDQSGVLRFTNDGSTPDHNSMPVSN